MPEQTANKIVQGQILQALPNTMYKVKLEDGREILTTPAGRLRRGFIRLLPGDFVQVEMTPYDEDRGRIVGKR